MWAYYSEAMQRGQRPTYREAAEALGFSFFGVVYHMKKLQEAGYVSGVGQNRVRAIEVRVPFLTMNGAGGPNEHKPSP